MTTLSNEPCVGRVSPDGYPTLPMRLNNIATPVIAWMAATLLLGALASALLTWWQADSNLRKAHSAFETHSFEVVERLPDGSLFQNVGVGCLISASFRRPTT